MAGGLTSSSNSSSSSKGKASPSKGDRSGDLLASADLINLLMRRAKEENFPLISKNFSCVRRNFVIFWSGAVLSFATKIKKQHHCFTQNLIF